MCVVSGHPLCSEGGEGLDKVVTGDTHWAVGTGRRGQRKGGGLWRKGEHKEGENISNNIKEKLAIGPMSYNGHQRRECVEEKQECAMPDLRWLCMKSHTGGTCGPTLEVHVVSPWRYVQTHCECLQLFSGAVCIAAAVYVT